MMDERDEFLLSRLADGDLTESERARAEELVRTSPEAAALVRQYRQLKPYQSSRENLMALHSAFPRLLEVCPILHYY